MREAFLMKEVWVPSENPFRFAEAIDPKTGERKFVLKGLMLPFNKVSRNNVLYNEQSILDKHKNLIGRPLMYNHKIDTDMLPIGHFIDSYIEDDGWHYKADIDPAEKDIIRKLERADLCHVSIQLIGGKVLERINEENKAYTEAWVEDIIEGSIVPAPGFLDTTAKFAEAIRREDMTLSTAGGAVSPARIITKKKEQGMGGELWDDYKVDELVNDDAEVKKLLDFLYKNGYAKKGEITNQMLNDGDVVASLFETALEKGFKPDKKYLKKESLEDDPVLEDYKALAYKLFKKQTYQLSDEERAEVDKEFKKLYGMKEKDSTDTGKANKEVITFDTVANALFSKNFNELTDEEKEKVYEEVKRRGGVNLGNDTDTGKYSPGSGAQIPDTKGMEQAHPTEVDGYSADDDGKYKVKEALPDEELRCAMCGWKGKAEDLYNQKCPKCGSKSVWNAENYKEGRRNVIATFDTEKDADEFIGDKKELSKQKTLTGKWSVVWKEIFINPDDIKSLSPEEKNKQMLRLSMTAEQDASNLYEQFANMTDNPKIKKTMLSVSKEEKTHAGEFHALLKKIDPEYVDELEKGEQEVSVEKISMKAEAYSLAEALKSEELTILKEYTYKVGDVIRIPYGISGIPVAKYVGQVGIITSETEKEFEILFSDGKKAKLPKDCVEISVIPEMS